MVKKKGNFGKIDENQPDDNQPAGKSAGDKLLEQIDQKEKAEEINGRLSQENRNITAIQQILYDTGGTSNRKKER